MDVESEKANKHQPIHEGERDGRTEGEGGSGDSEYTYEDVDEEVEDEEEEGEAEADQVTKDHIIFLGKRR